LKDKLGKTGAKGTGKEFNNFPFTRKNVENQTVKQNEKKIGIFHLV
jgi:hypothetical protein